MGVELVFYEPPFVLQVEFLDPGFDVGYVDVRALDFEDAGDIAEMFFGISLTEEVEFLDDDVFG